MSVKDELNVVDPANMYSLRQLDPSWGDRIPERCTKCGRPMYVKQPWKAKGYDSKTGERNSYEAIVYCIKLKGFSKLWAGYHDRRALIYTPAKFSYVYSAPKDKGKYAGLNVLEILIRGPF